jgi:hypothetical protein
MGATYTAGLIGSVEEGLLEREGAIAIHLRLNHYPPVPSSMVGPCLEAIEIAQRSQWGDADASDPVTLPNGVTWRGEDSAPAWSIVEGFHLDQFIEGEGE